MMSVRMISSCQFLACLVWVGLGAAAMGQGGLEPSAGPAPMMKTLDQVEPRIPIDGSTALTNPGSYYLTDNITGTITIASSHVTLDLMGFRVRSEGGSAAAGAPAILVDGPHANVVIRNGSVSSQFGDAIDATAGEPNSMGRIEYIRVDQAYQRGIAVESGYVVENCFVQGADVAGIWIGGNSTVINNTMTGNNIGLYMSHSPLHLAQNARVEGNIVYGNINNYELVPGNHIHLLLSEIPVVINVPLKATLVSDLYMPLELVEHGISVESDYVVIDLAGHQLIGPGFPSGSAVFQDSMWRNLHLKNGIVRDWMGNESDVWDAVRAFGSYSRVENITAVNNISGFILGYAAYADNLHAVSNQLDGIRMFFECFMQNSFAVHNGRDGFYTAASRSKMESCVASRNGRHGFHLETGGKLSHCGAFVNAESGFHGQNMKLLNVEGSANLDGVHLTAANAMIRDSRFHANYRYGIRLGNRADVRDNVISRNGFFSAVDGIGLFVEGENNQISGNTLIGNQEGVVVTGVNNILTGNRVSSSDELNWNIAASNVCFVVEGMTGGAFTGDSGGAGIGTFDPYANFTF